MEEEEEVNPYVDDYPFIGRTEYFERWEENWKRHKIFGIFGMQCVGKSRTVWEFLRQKRRKCKEKMELKMVHIDLRKAENLDIIRIRLLAEILENSPDKSEDDRSWIDAVLCSIKENSKETFAIVMDNAEDVILGSLKDPFLSLCQKLVFAAGISNVKMFIVSTCEFLISNKKRVFFKEEMKPMNEEEGVLLLKEVVKDPVIGLDDHAAQIVKLSGSLPSVIIMSGSEMTEDGGLLTPTELIELLMKCRLEILSREFYPEEERTDSLMMNFINRLSKVLRDQMAVLSYIPGTFDDEAATGMLEHDSSAMAKHKSLIPLRKHHMLQYDAENKRFNIHGLLKDCLNIMDLVRDYPMIRRRYAKVFYAVFDKLQRKLNSPQYADALKDISLEHQNLQKLMTDVEYSDYETFPFFVKMVEIGQDLLETHLKSNCFEFFENCLQLSYKLADKTQKATILIGYGRAQTNVKGNYESGQEKLCQAIEVLDDLPCTFATAQAYQSLGFTLQRKGEVEEGLRYLEEALKIETELQIPNNRLTLSTLSSLGIVNVFIGNFEDGKKYHLESLKRRLSLLQTEKHPHIGACYNNLGLLYENMGEYDKALEYYEKGLQVKIDTKAPLASRLISVCNVAMQCMRQGDLQRANSLIVEAENELKGHSSASTFIESFIKDCLAQVLIKQGKYHEALGVIHSAILIRRLATPNNLTLTESLYHRADAYRGLKNYKSAKTVLNRALKMGEQSIRQMPRTTIMLNCYELMLDIYMEEGNRDEAAGFYVRAKQELIRILGLYQKYGCPKKESQLGEQLRNLEQKWNAFCSASFPSDSPAIGIAGEAESEDSIAREKRAAKKKEKMLREDFEVGSCKEEEETVAQRRPELRVNTERRPPSSTARPSQSSTTPQSGQSPVYRLSYAGTPQDVNENRYFPQHRPPLMSSSSGENATIFEEVVLGGESEPNEESKKKVPTPIPTPTPNPNPLSSSSSSSSSAQNDLSATEKANPYPDQKKSVNFDKINFQNMNLTTTEAENLNKNPLPKDYHLSKFGIGIGIGKQRNSKEMESVVEENKMNNLTKERVTSHFTSTPSIEENDAYIVPGFQTSVDTNSDPSKCDPHETVPKEVLDSNAKSLDENLKDQKSKTESADQKSVDNKNSASYWNSELTSLLGNGESGEGGGEEGEGEKAVGFDETEESKVCDKNHGRILSVFSTVSKFFSLPIPDTNSSESQDKEKDKDNQKEEDQNPNSSFSPFSI